jgi:hypothetical protein
VTEDTFQKFILWSYTSQYWHQHIEKLTYESLPDTIKSRLAQLLDRHSRAFLNLCRTGNQTLLWRRFWGFKRNLQPKQVCPPLLYCVSCASLWGTRYLIENGENIEEVTDHGVDGTCFALQCAAGEGNTKIAKFLLHRGANSNTQGGLYGNALQAAARNDTKIVQVLLDRGAEINAEGGVHGNALQAAAFSRKPEIVQLLLDKGAEINMQGGEYGNALQTAAGNGHTEIVQVLLDKGADINARCEEYGNALQAAVARKNYNVAKFLHSRGAKVDPPGPEWEDVLSHVSEGYGEARVGLLKEFQADPTGFLAKERIVTEEGEDDGDEDS